MLVGLRVPDYRRLFLHGQPKQRLCQIRMNPGSSFLPFRSTFGAHIPCLRELPVGKGFGKPLHLLQPQHFVRVHTEFPAYLFVCPTVLAEQRHEPRRKLMCPSRHIVPDGGGDAILNTFVEPDYGQISAKALPYLCVHLRHLPPMKTVYYDMPLAISGHHNGHGETVLADRQLE